MVTLRNGKNTNPFPTGCRPSIRTPDTRYRGGYDAKHSQVTRRVIVKKDKLARVGAKKPALVPTQNKKLMEAAAASAVLRRVNKDAVRKKLMAKFHMEQPVVDMIISTILTGLKKVNFDEIIGQEEAVKSVRERIVYPALNPDLFKGQKVLKPPRGVLLYGPTGNGKTLLAKACASQTHYNFMNVSASALVSKWVGDSEKLVKLLFECAKEIQPTIIFIDEIDAMLSQRCGAEREDTRRFKNEFLVHFDGMLCSNDDRILILGATNLPHCIDSAALRRFDLRVYMGPPTLLAREKFLRTILKEVKQKPSDSEVKAIAKLTDKFSASDLGTVARNAAWLSLGSMAPDRIPTLKVHQIPKVTLAHFKQVIASFIPSNNAEDMAAIANWTNQNRDRAGV